VSFNTPVAYEVDVADEGTVFGIADETASWTSLSPHSPSDPEFAVEFDLFRPGGVAPFTLNDGGMNDGG
jgi:hypothetical protein